MYGIIDVGSNSVRLGVTDGENTRIKVLETTRLGEGLLQTGRLSEAAQERSLSAIGKLKEQALQSGVEGVYAFATEAVRKAENGADFVREAQRRTGVAIEILSGETEAEIGLLGAVTERFGAVLDVGGASTELAVKTEEGFDKKSLPLGCVLLKNLCGEDADKLERVTDDALKAAGLLSVSKEVPLYGIGGTATTLAAFSLGLKAYDPDRVTGTVISAKQAEELYRAVAALSVKEREERGIPAGRSDIIAGGAFWIAKILRRLGNRDMVVSDRDNIEGYAKRIAQRKPLAERSDNV